MTPSGPGERIRVLLAEGSPALRDELTRLIDADGRFRVIGFASDGYQAVRLTARLRPDVIAMNLFLPDLDGIGATRHIMAQTPTPIVITCSAAEGAPAELVEEALRVGAVTVLQTPLLIGAIRRAQSAQELLTAMRLMAEVKVVRRPASRVLRLVSHPRTPQVVDSLAGSGRHPLALAVAASTGGPQAIQSVLQALGSDLDVPVFVVQHMSPGFLDGMVSWLAATCPQAVRLAAQDEAPVGGTVYVAPENSHLLVTRGRRLALSKAPPIGGFRPSANALFESAAEAYGAHVVGAVLTGMGEDGASGLAALHRAGACTIAQDEASAVVYGMPRAAAAAAEHVLSLDTIGPAIRILLGLK